MDDCLLRWVAAFLTNRSRRFIISELLSKPEVLHSYGGIPREVSLLHYYSLSYLNDWSSRDHTG